MKEKPMEQFLDILNKQDWMIDNLKPKRDKTLDDLSYERHCYITWVMHRSDVRSLFSKTVLQKAIRDVNYFYQ